MLTKNFGKRKIYGFKPGTFITEKMASPVRQAIVVIGAKKMKDKGFVYYIDSNSDQSNGGQIFKISYERFVQSISDPNFNNSVKAKTFHLFKIPFGYQSNWGKMKISAANDTDNVENMTTKIASLKIDKK